MSAHLPRDAIRAAVAQRLGLHFPPERWNELARGFGDAARDIGCAVEDFMRAFVAGDLDRPGFDALARRLTVGETYFFRAPEIHAVLREQVLPELIRKRADTRRLRFWSAGCCTGEEPYTLALLLRELLPDIGDWNISILATDVNPAFLRQAREGTWGEWSFRATSGEMRRRYFHAAGKGRFTIDPLVRDMVHFAPLNLSEAIYPSLATDTNAMDLILCRNVLMYFEPGQAKDVAARLHAALRPDGWLSVAPCEVSSTLFANFVPVSFPGVVLYRKAEAQPIPREAMSAVPAATRVSLAHRGAQQSRSVPSRPRLQPAMPSTSSAATPAADPSLLERRARRLADEGRLEEAMDACRRWGEERKLEIGPHYLGALIAMELGDLAAATDALRRCDYLAPDEPMVAHAAANLARLRGRPRDSIAHFHRALELLAAHPGDDIVALSGGLSVARLAAHVRQLIESEPLDGIAA